MGYQQFSTVGFKDFKEDKGGTGILILAVILLAAALAFAFWPRDDNKQKVDAKGIMQMEMTPADAITLGDVVTDIKGNAKVEVTKEDSPDGKDKVVKQRSDKMMELSTVGIEPTTLRFCLCALLTRPKV